MTPKDLRAKKDQDIDALITKWGGELAVLKVQASVGQCAKPTQIGVLRRSIARAKTILKERGDNAVSDS